MSSTTVLERELLSASSARARHSHHRNEDANLILQLGTVVTAALNEIDSPPSSECTITPPSRSHVNRTLHETKRMDDRYNSASDHLKYRSNNHIVPYQFVLQDHNYGAPPPPTPPLSPSPPSCSSGPLRTLQTHHQPPPLTAQDLCGMAALATVADQVRTGTAISSLLMQAEEDSRGSPLSSDEHDEPGPEGEETETAAEGEGDEDSVTRCICDFEHDDGYMICCDKCCVWQHVDCMGIDRSNIPEEYLCEVCQPRRVDRNRARNLQMRKQMHNDTSSSDDETIKRLPPASTQARRLSGSAARKRPAKREAKKVVKRQRRDSAAVAAREQRVSERRANKRKESMLSSSISSPVKSESKRIGTRRRSKNKGESVDEDTQDCWGNSNGGEVERRATQPLRQWIDSYEEAVTNHYSPELRARISSIKVNGVHSDFKVASSAVQRCRTSLQENGTKILIATSTLHANQPIIEVRGKYMLANQQSMRRGGGGGALSPSSSPYLLFYQLPKESTEVCVDARTYGNDARFVRRSCKPNAEVRHCIEKGTLHLYLVASGQLERHAEITIKHEDGGARFPCKDCPPPPCTTPASSRNGFVSQDSSERGERRRRGSRRSTISEEGLTTPTAAVEPTASPPVSAPAAAPTPPSTVAAATPAATASVSPVVTAVTNPSPPTPTPAPPSPSPPAPVVNTPVTRRGPKSPTKNTPSSAQPPSTPTPSQIAQGEDSNDGTPSPHDDRESASDKRKMTREERKMEAIIKAFERLEKAEQRKQQQQQSRRGERGDRESESSGPVSRHASRDDTEPEEHETVSSRRKGRRTRGRSSSGASNQATSADESCGAPMLSPATPACASPRALASPPPPPVPSPEKNTPAAILSSCLGFKFPKTKKVLMNEWLNKPSEAPVSPVKLESPDDGIMVGRSGSAAVKKRWLRQAISEESELPATPTCSSPNSRAGSPPCGDYVTPLKKRRLARASVSSEQSFTPPTTPASDKEGTHSPELEEAPPVASDTSDPKALPASQIKNSERCVEESLKVLSADKNFLNKVMPEKVVDVTSKLTPAPTVYTSPVKEELSSMPVKIKEEPKQEVGNQVDKKPVVEVKKEEVVDKPSSPLPPPKAPSTPPPHPQSPLSAPPTPSAATTPEKVENKEGLTPASIKRKLSISEYRQRKQREEVKGEGSEGTTSPASQDEERPISAAAGSPTETLLEIADVKTEGAVPVGGAYMRWSSEPTLVERQRENLTERLKREFGLFVDEQDANRLAALKKQAGIIATTSATTTTATPVSVNSAIQVNANNVLPVLPPLEPPAFRPESPHNIPLPPCSPPPLHDLLADPPPPPPPPQPVPPPLLPVPPPSLPITPLSLPAITTNTITVHSKSGAKTATVTVQNGPSMKNQLGKSLLLGGVQSSKHQTAPQATSGIVLNNKKPIPTSSFHNNLTRPSS